MLDINQAFFSAAQRSGDYPPSFGGSQLIYAAVLFVLLAVSAVAMQVFLEEADRYYRSDVARRSSSGIYARLQMVLMLSFITAVAPDGLYLLAFGEVSSYDLGRILIADRMFDFVSGMMFFYWWWLRARTYDVIEVQLAADLGIKRYWVSFDRLKNKLTLLSLSLVIALGVALAK